MANNIWRYITGTLRFFLLDFGIAQLLRVFQTKRGDTLEVRLPHLPDTLKIRPTKADVLVLWQTFGLNQCVLTHVSSPQLIVDAGANIGCTALFFAKTYPKAAIVAVEPDVQNAELARRNCRTYPNVRIVEGAVWNQAKMLEIENPDGESWAFRMRERSIEETSEGIRGYTIDELSNGATIDVLKVDIEGGEQQLFQYDTHWLARVQTMLVEVHGKECRNAVAQAAQQEAFRVLPPQGEYVVYAR
ncbi:MAG: FkbM family methyltransferase [Candidatus Kapaibacterium sp.]|nr:MAG: FkbM family methyltransferase [Candidatus Kapabacteria bacterium]